MKEVKSAIIIDNEDLDNFVNRKILENYGVANLVSFKNAAVAFEYLLVSEVKCDLIFVDLHMPIFNGFEFTDKFFQYKLNERHGKICIITSSLNPLDKLTCNEKNIIFIDKPLTVDKLKRLTF